MALEGAVAAVADHKVWGRRESSAYPDGTNLPIMARDNHWNEKLTLGPTRVLVGSSVGSRSGLSSPCATASASQKLYCPRNLMFRCPSGDSLATSSGATSTSLERKCSSGRIHVDRVPEDDDVQHEAECTELILLAFTTALPNSALDTRGRCRLPRYRGSPRADPARPQARDRSPASAPAADDPGGSDAHRRRPRGAPPGAFAECRSAPRPGVATASLLPDP